MSEERILELLTRNHSNAPITSISKYDSETITNVSKTIAELIYKDINSNLHSNIEKRINLIKFIRTFVNIKPDHLHLDGSNYLIALDTINDYLKNQNLIVTSDTADGSVNSSLLSTICNHYEEIDEKQRNIAALKDFVAGKDQEKLLHFKAHTSIQFEPKSIRSFVANLLNVVIVDKELEENDKSEAKQRFSVNFRYLQVECIHGLLNIMQTNDCTVEVLEKLLARIASYKDLIKPESDLLDYIILSSLNDMAKHLVLKHFKFMLEKYVIRFCIEILKDDATVMELFKRASTMGDIVKLAEADIEIKYTVVQMLLELFKLSNYNEKLLVLLQIFQNENK